MVRGLISRVWQSRKDKRPESIYFFTLHKCASTLFGDFVLKRFKGLEHVDHAAAIYGSKSASQPPVFRDRGYIYGPLRVSASRRSPVYENVIAPAMEGSLLRHRNVLLLVRDPRDILVSCYFSFGYSHGSSVNSEIHAQQEVLRKRILERENLDEFVLRSAQAIARHFKKLESIRRRCATSLVLRYEDMIHDFDAFAGRLQEFARLEEGAAEALHARSRPRGYENLHAHHRSGRTGGFREKLLPGTIAELNATFGETLGRFGYTP